MKYLHFPVCVLFFLLVSSVGADIVIKGTVRVLLVAIDDYHSPWQPLSGCVADAERFVDTLKAPVVNQSDIIGSHDTITRLYNENATKDAIIKNIQDVLVSPSAQHDTLILYFSGHGQNVSEIALQSAIVPVNSTKDKNNHRSLISDYELAHLFAASRTSRVLIVFDSPYSGGFTHEVFCRGSDNQDANNFAIITTGDVKGLHYRFDEDQWKKVEVENQKNGSLLTSALCEALRRNSDIRFRDLPDDLQEKMKYWIGKNGFREYRDLQKPSIEAGNLVWSLRGFVGQDYKPRQLVFKAPMTSPEQVNCSHTINAESGTKKEESNTACRVLAIGVDKYPGLSSSYSGTVDCKAFVDALSRQYGLASNQLKLLTDGQATKQGIVQAIKEHLIAPSVSGGTIVLYFSGAGIPVPDINGDEEGDEEVSLAAFDAATKNPDTWLRDYDLIPLLATSKASRVFVFLDCDHSGGFTKTQLEKLAANSPDKSIVIFASAASNESNSFFDADELDYLEMNNQKPSSCFTSAFIASLAEKPNQNLNELANAIRTINKRWEKALGVREWSTTTPRFSIPNPDITLSHFLLGTEPTSNEK